MAVAGPDNIDGRYFRLVVADVGRVAQVPLQLHKPFTPPGRGQDESRRRWRSRVASSANARGSSPWGAVGAGDISLKVLGLLRCGCAGGGDDGGSGRRLERSRRTLLWWKRPLEETYRMGEGGEAGGMAPPRHGEGRHWPLCTIRGERLLPRALCPALKVWSGRRAATRVLCYKANRSGRGQF
jgi:hypothetical protein